MGISTGSYQTGLLGVGSALVTGAIWIVKALAPYGIFVAIDEVAEYMEATGETEETAEASEGVPLIPGARQISCSNYNNWLTSAKARLTADNLENKFVPFWTEWYSAACGEGATVSGARNATVGAAMLIDWAEKKQMPGVVEDAQADLPPYLSAKSEASKGASIVTVPEKGETRSAVRFVLPLVVAVAVFAIAATYTDD